MATSSGNKIKRWLAIRGNVSILLIKSGEKNEYNRGGCEGA